MLPLVSIGLPTYNNPEGLKKAINCLLSQTYSNIELFISNNRSPNPEVQRIIEETALRDSRVRYINQETNIGGLLNFKYVFEQAKAEFFMWAADDDEWDPEFISVCMQPIINDPSVVLSFCHVRQRDPKDGQLLNPHFSDNVASNSDSMWLRSIKYLIWSGSNNCFYGIYRKKVIDQTFFAKRFGSDHLAVLGVLYYGKLHIADESLYTYSMFGRGFQRNHFHNFYNETYKKVLVTLSSTIMWFYEFLYFIWTYPQYSFLDRMVLSFFNVIRFLRFKYWRRFAGDLRALVTRRDIWNFLG